MLFVFYKHGNYYFELSAGLLVLYLLVIIYGSFQIKANYFVNSINKGNIDSIYFTFDDGPDPDITPKIIELLEAEQLKAIFFVIGNKVEKYPHIVKDLFDKGHLIANHTYTHSNKIALFSTEELMNDIKKCTVAIEQVTSKTPTFFRPPYGITTPRYSRALKQLGMQSIGWTLRSFDTLAKSKELFVEKIKKQITPGAIILFHDTKRITLDALPEIIRHCKKNGIKIASFPN